MGASVTSYYFATTVTVYARDNEWCGLGTKYLIDRGQCAENDTSISQFTIDCDTTVVTPITSSLGGLSTSAKIATGVNVPVCSLALAAVAGWLFIRWRKRKRVARLEPTSLCAEAESKSAYAEADGEGARHKYEMGDGA